MKYLDAIDKLDKQKEILERIEMESCFFMDNYSVDPQFIYAYDTAKTICNKNKSIYYWFLAKDRSYKEYLKFMKARKIVMAAARYSEELLNLKKSMKHNAVSYNIFFYGKDKFSEILENKNFKNFTFIDNKYIKFVELVSSEKIFYVVSLMPISKITSMKLEPGEYLSDDEFILRDHLE